MCCHVGQFFHSGYLLFYIGKNSPPKSELSPEILLCTYLISGIELIVFAFLGDELVVGTALDDPALFQDHDTVGIADRGKTMGNNEGGSALHELVHTILYNALCSGIDGAGGLVEDQHRRVGDGSSGNREKLSLALA